MHKLIVGNWKMNNTIEESVSLIRALKNKLKAVNNVNNVGIVVCPPFTSLSEVKKELKGSKIEFGAQNLYFEDKGAFTGEVSVLMVKELCKYAIIGHSERRNTFNESDELINKKIIAALEHNLTPIFCVGEKLEQREKGHELNVVSEQLKIGLNSVSRHRAAKIIIAYEPVWAIGTGKNATPEQAESMHLFIRSFLAKKYSRDAAEKIRILYGGSVNPKNAKELLSRKNIDGALVGGASLKADDFCRIAEIGAGLINYYVHS